MIGGNMDEILIPLKDLAKDATIPQLKYWTKLLGVLLIVRGRVAHVYNNDAQRLLKVAELVKEGKSPQEAAEIIGTANQAIITSTEAGNNSGILDLSEKIERLERRNEGVEKALLAMVDEIRNLRQENTNLKQYLMPPQEPITAVIPWQPETPKDPLEGMTWLQRAYVQIFEPQKMRQYDS